LKTALGLLVALVMVLVLAPLWGWMAAFAFGGIAKLGQLLSTGNLTDGMLAFRAGVMIGGVAAVWSLLEVAAQDRSRGYLLAGLLLAAGFFSLLLGTGKSPVGGETTPMASKDAEKLATGEGSGEEEWLSRSAYERDAAEKVLLIARAAARGNQQLADEAMEDLQRWAGRRQRLPGRDQKLDYEVAKDRFYATLNGTADPAGSAELRRERGAAVEAMWAAVPDVTLAGVQLLIHRLAGLNSSMRMQAVSAKSASTADALNTQLDEIVSLQEALLGYQPAMPELWESYASMVVDSDEELALGALATAEKLVRHRGAVGAQPGLIQASQRMIRKDLEFHASLLPESSMARLAILKARVSMLSTKPVGPGTQHVGSGSTARSAEIAEQALPEARRVLSGRGLRAEVGLSPPLVPNLFASKGEILVDLPAAGFDALESPIPIPHSGIKSDGQMVLVIDVLKGGVITSVLIEQSSGDPVLDSNARMAARSWRATGSITSAGERRRVPVQFKVALKSAEIEAGAIVERANGASPSEFLGMLLADKARTKPARYPRAAWDKDIEGRVVLLITLSGDGAVVGAAVEESSGSAILDRAAREAALGWNVEPGMATADVDKISLRVPVVFRIH